MAMSRGGDGAGAEPRPSHGAKSKRQVGWAGDGMGVGRGEPARVPSAHAQVKASHHLALGRREGGPGPNRKPGSGTFTPGLWASTY